MLDTVLSGFLDGFIVGSAAIWTVIFCDFMAGKMLAAWDAPLPVKTTVEQPAIEEAIEQPAEKAAEVEKQPVEVEEVAEVEAIEAEQAKEVVEVIDTPQAEEVPAPVESVSVEEMDLTELRKMGRLYAIKNWHCMKEGRLRQELSRTLATV